MVLLGLHDHVAMTLKDIIFAEPPRLQNRISGMHNHIDRWIDKQIENRYYPFFL